MLFYNVFLIIIDISYWTKCNITGDEIPPTFGHTSHRIGSNVFITGGCSTIHERALSTKIYELNFTEVINKKDFNASVNVMSVPCEHVRMYHASELVGNEVIVVGGRIVGVHGTEPNTKCTNGGFVLQHK
jgi:hypothetical protein